MLFSKLNKDNNPHSGFSKRIIILISCFVLFVSIAVGATFAWYNTNYRIHSTQGDLYSAEAAYSIGYEVFKYEGDHGIKVKDGTTTMNLYDKVYPKNNAKASIILRAILSDDYAQYVDSNGVVHLSLDCAYSGTGREDGDANGDGIIDYLSNVINVKAAYIPNITNNAMAGNYDKDRYQSEDDYIYEAASDYFDSIDDSVKFVETTRIEGVNESSTSYKLTTFTQISNFDNRTELKGESIVDADNVTVTDSYEYYYLISYGTNYMYLGNAVSRQNITLTAENIAANLQQFGFKVKRNGTTSQYSFENNGKFLGNNGNTITVSDAEQFYTLSDGMVFVPASGSTRRIRYNNNAFSLSTNTGDSTNLTITQVEKKTTTRYRAAANSLGNKQITISAPLGQTFKASDGFYYMYLQFDYDPTLIDAYFLQNHIIFKVGADEQSGTEFKDMFTINVIKET